MSISYSDITIQQSPYSILFNNELTKKYKFLLFKEGQVVQGREINVLIRTMNDKITQILSFMGIEDGAVLEGSVPSIDGTSVTVPANVYVWAKGEVNTKSTPTTLTISGTGHEYIGCTVTRTIVNSNDDPTLLDPATAWINEFGEGGAAPNRGQPGADRCKYELSFSTTNYEYVLWHIKDGVLQNTADKPSDFPTIESIERRHRNTNGDGSEHPVNVYQLKIDDDNTKIGIGNNTFYIWGREIGKAIPEFLTLALAKEYDFVNGETKMYHSGTASYKTNELPIRDLSDIQMTVEGYVYVPRGGTDFDQVCDPVGGYPLAGYLCPTRGSMVETLEVYENGSSNPLDVHTYDYQENVDYTVTNNGIDWSLGGDDPVGDHYWVHLKVRINAILGIRTFHAVTDEAVSCSGTEYVDLAHNDAVGVADDDDVCRVTIGNQAGGDDYVEGIDFEIVNHYDGYTNANKDPNQAWTENDKAQIKWLNAPYPSGTVYVTYGYWEHTKEGHLTARNSFSDAYNPAINTEELHAEWNSGYRNYIFFNTATTEKPVDHSEPSYDYNVYRAQRAIVQLGYDDAYVVVRGTKARYPKYPIGTERALTLAKIHLPPDSQDILIDVIDCANMRMRDIHELEKKVYDTHALVMESRLRVDETNKNPPVDNEKGNWGDTMNDSRPQKMGCDPLFNWNGIRHNTTLDPLEGVHRLGFSNQSLLTLRPNGASSTVRVGDPDKHDHYITLSYQIPEQNMTPQRLKQPYCSDIFGINPYSVFTNGPFISLDPTESNWIDQQVIFRNELASLDNFTPASMGPIRQVLNTNQIWNFLVPSVTPAERSQWELGINNTLKQMVTFMHQDTIKISGKEFVAGKALSLKMDDVTVAMTATGDTEQGSNGTVIAEDDGTFTATFTIPAEIPSGKKLVSVQEADTGREAKTMFKGMTVREVVIVDPPPPPPPVTFPTNSRDPIGQEIALDRSYDIAQIDFFFKQKDSSEGGFCFIRKEKDGIPSQDNMGYFTFTPSDITVSNTGSVASSFILPDPIPLDGDVMYFVGLGSESTNYQIFYAKAMGVDLNSSNPQVVISQQTYPWGNMKSSSNGVSWTDHQLDDLKFYLRPAVYSGTGILYIEEETVDFTSFVLAADYILRPGTALKWYYAINGSNTWVAFQPNEAVEMSTQGHSLKFKIEFSSNDQYASPMLRNSITCHVRTNSSSSDYIGKNLDQTHDLYYRQKMSVDTYLPSGTSISAYVSIDNGLTWLSAGDPESSISVGNGFYRKRWDIGYFIDPPTLETNDLTPSATGGVLPNDEYFYVITATNEYGETIGSSQRSCTVSGGTNTGKVVIDMQGNYPDGATGCRVYRGTVSGQNYLEYIFDTTPDTITDDGSDPEHSDSQTPPSVATARDYKSYWKARFRLTTSNICNSPKIRMAYATLD